MKNDPETRKDMYENIIIGGGMSMTQNFDKRFTEELQKVTPSSFKIKIWGQTDRKIMAWTGGAIFSQLPAFQTMCITKADYEEAGP